MTNGIHGIQVKVGCVPRIVCGQGTINLSNSILIALHTIENQQNLLS
jgi:hypothetical protein